MRVEVVSIQAAMAGRESIVWAGDVPVDEGGRDPGQVNDDLFRLFNRVDEDDWWLEASSFKLPSLSVGDLLVWGSVTWRVAGWGFERITGNDDYAIALALYALKTAAEPPEAD